MPEKLLRPYLSTLILILSVGELSFSQENPSVEYEYSSRVLYLIENNTRAFDVIGRGDKLKCKTFERSSLSGTLDSIGDSFIVVRHTLISINQLRAIKRIGRLSNYSSRTAYQSNPVGSPNILFKLVGNTAGSLSTAEKRKLKRSYNAKSWVFETRLINFKD